MSAVIEIKVRCHANLADAVASAVGDWARIEEQWWEQANATLTGLNAKAYAVRQRWLQADFELLRADGRLRGTRTAFVRPVLVAEMQRRRWMTRRWNDLPPGERSRRARPWGAEDQKLDAAFRVYLDPELGERLIRACYWTSLPYVQQLQALSDRSGDYGHNQRGPGIGYRPAAGRADLVAKIITPAEVLRAAASSAVDQHRQAQLQPVDYLASPGTR